MLHFSLFIFQSQSKSHPGKWADMIVEELKSLIKVLKEYRRKRKTDLQLFKKFYSDVEQFNAMATPSKKAEVQYYYPCLYDNTGLTVIEPIYFYQDAWAFERIYFRKPGQHIDIGSNHKFVAHLSKIVNLTMVDIRPLSLPMNSIKFIEGSILNLPFSSNSIDSLSGLSVIEHVGLGRYGDPLDPDGPDKAFREITRVLKPGADFYVSVPIEEKDKVYFNAHRAFNEESLLKHTLSAYEVTDRKYIYGGNYLAEKANGFGIGLYHLKKLK